MAEQTVHGVVFLDEATGQWVAMCLEYDVATQGDSEEHAFEMLKEAVELHMEFAPPPDEDLEFQAVGSEPVVRKVTVQTPDAAERIEQALCRPWRASRRCDAVGWRNAGL